MNYNIISSDENGTPGGVSFLVEIAERNESSLHTTLSGFDQAAQT
jgi:hypothetical protein